MKRWSARPLAVLAMVVAILIGTTGPAQANHAWSTYHWATTLSPAAPTFTLQLGDSMTLNWKEHLSTASADWSSVAYDGQTDKFNNFVTNPLHTDIVTGANAGKKRCGAVSGRVEVCNGAYGQNGWLGLAQIWLSNGHIVQGVAKMNDTYFSLDKYNNRYEKLHVVCQEVGHTFGLGHQDESGASLNTCMDYFSNTGTNAIDKSTHPNVHDYGQLTAIYSHNDGYTSVAATAAAAAVVRGLGGEAGADGQGTPAGAAQARGSWYVQDLGSGRALITHIYWADGGN